MAEDCLNAEGIFDGKDYLDVPALLKLKQQRGVTISLVIPTLEEEDNIGRTLAIVNEKVGRELLDEVMVIDGGSKDKTVEIAEANGAHVVHAKDVCPEFNSRGKGVQLWKSLCVTKGDLILYCDADISNFSELFILGLIGPLLQCPKYRYAKAFYKRALRVNGEVQEGGGGRVTEICARPVFSLYYPELRHIIQPLGGEYAGWRKDLERVCYTSGYGVETKLLLQFARVFGAQTICQVNLHEKSHRHQQLAALSKMSFVIMQTFMRDMAERYDTPLMVHRMNHTLWIQKQTSKNDSLNKDRSEEHVHCNSSGTEVGGRVGDFLVECHVNDTHLPPIVGLTSYAKQVYPGFRRISLYACRHGETHHQLNHRIMGWTNATLTDEGLRQAETLGRRIKNNGLSIKHVVSSDLTRAVQTATAIINASGSNDVKLSTDKRVREKGKGQFENKTKEEILLDKKFGGEWSLGRLTDPQAIPPGGEETAHFTSRLVEFLENLAEEKETNNAGDTLLVTHHGVIWELYRFCYGIERSPDLAAEMPESTVGPIFTEAEFEGKITLWKLDFLVKDIKIPTGEPTAKLDKTGVKKRRTLSSEADSARVCFRGMQMLKADVLAKS